MKNWYISDHHFNNYNINKYCDRPYLHKVDGNDIFLNGSKVDSGSSNDESIKKSVNMTVKNMNKDFIEKWNSKIDINDRVYYIGDFAFPCSVDEGKKLLTTLNGYKILIVGNHDKSHKVMLEMGFNEVYEELDIEINGQMVHLSHYPYMDNYIAFNTTWNKKIEQYTHKRDDQYELIDKILKDEDPYSNIRYYIDNYKIDEVKNKLNVLFSVNLNNQNPKNKKYIDFRKKMHGILIGTKKINDSNILIHGHTHSKIKRSFNMINVSCDAWNYAPVSEDEIINQMDEYKKELFSIRMIDSVEDYNQNKEKFDFFESFTHKNNNEDIRTIQENSRLFYSIINYSKESIKIPVNYSRQWYNIVKKYELFISKDKLTSFLFYKGKCRNANIAYWTGSKFIHVRSKWGETFLEDIKHPEDEQNYDVFVPFEVIDSNDPSLDILKKHLTEANLI